MRSRTIEAPERVAPLEGVGPLAVDLVRRPLAETWAMLPGDLPAGVALDLAAHHARVALCLLCKAQGLEPGSVLDGRLAEGISRYGHPLRPDTMKPDGTPYDWNLEALGEAADLPIYLAAGEASRGAA